MKTLIPAYITVRFQKYFATIAPRRGALRSVLLLAILLTSVCQALASNDTPPPKSEEKEIKIEKPYAWTLLQPLGQRMPADIDTVTLNYSRQAVASEISDAWVTTGNLGAEGKNMLFTGQKCISSFFLADALRHWFPNSSNMKFYNTRVPMTLLSYGTGGGRETAQDRLNGIFSGNINSKAQVGALVDYLYSKGSYEKQALKHLVWGASGSYIGDRYEFQGFYNHYNLLNKENGGITDVLYIKDPAVVQGGDSKVNAKSIPVNLYHAHTRLVGQELYLNNRYKIGFWKEDPAKNETEEDTVPSRHYVPVTSVIWTLDYRADRHKFIDDDTEEMKEFYGRSYLNPYITDDVTSWWRVSNTAGLALHEGFHKYAKFGLAAYAIYEIREYKQTADTLDRTDPTLELTPWPEGIKDFKPRTKGSLVWVGGELTHRQGSLLNYEANARFGLVGAVAGDIELNGKLSTRFPVMGDSLRVDAFASFQNLEPTFFLKQYVSNHFMWQNDFGKTRTVKFGGDLGWDKSSTYINITAANIQNSVYFNNEAISTQHKGSVQVFSAALKQNFKIGMLHWQNRLTFQTSTNQAVLPLPKFVAYSNLFILCNIATLKLQLGVDCDYYTSYYAPGYQPATATFYNQTTEKLGNYPFMNVYANMKLSRARFYVLYSHFNQGWLGGKNYFSSPKYPLNPARFLMGVSVDFAN